jgi:hypothetical protein
MIKRLDWDRGQIILVMSITLITIILLVSTIIYSTSIQHLFFDYNPSREIVMNIDSDFRRVLTRILANATAKYNLTAEMDVPRRIANLTFSYWLISTQAAYAGKGLHIETRLIDEPVQSARGMTLTIYNLTRDGEPDKPRNYVFNYPERRLEDRLFKLFWYRPNSISAIGAEISVDATYRGVVGWRAAHILLLNLTITSVIPREKDGILELNVIVLRENSIPVSDLRAGNFEIYLFDPTVPPGVYCWRRVSVNEMTLTYNGGGNYTISITPRFYDPSSTSVRLFWRWEGQQGNQPHQPGYYQFILVRVQDNRGIIVESYTYAGIEYAIQANAVEPFYTGDPSKVKETYVFELLPNGTMYWYNTRLSSPENNPPIPLPPVKQVRVMATRNWPSDPAFYEVPYQTEVWDDRYLWPNSDKFLEWRKRIMNGSKLVFELNYPPGCSLQKVLLTWLEDADVREPEYRLHMTLSGAFATVDNGKYVLTLLASPTSYWVDWSISIQDPRSGTHVEYVLLGYDVYRMPSGGWWFPRKIPADDWMILPRPQDKGGVLVAEAPVRLVAFRKSNRTQERPPEGPVSYDEMHYETILYIPYNVSYFLYVANATWLRSVRMDYPYLSLMGMIGGTETDAGSPLRVKWGSLATSVKNPSIVNGTYSNVRNIMHRDRNNSPANIPSAQAYGNWTVLYNEYAGMAIFASEDFIDELRSYFIGGVRRDQLWVWTTADYQRRVMEYDAIFWSRASTTPYDTDPANKIQFKVAGFLTEGGIAATPFINASLWYNGTDRNALPFRTVENPQGTVGGELVLAKRSAFIYDDFSTDPFSSGRLATNTGNWSWNPSGYIQVSANAPSGSWGGAHVAYFTNNTPPEATTIYVFSKELFSTTDRNQHAGLTMINSDNGFYTLEFYRDTGNRRLGIWCYAGSPPRWTNVARTGNLGGLTDNTWFLFLGSRNVNTGAMRLTVYSSGGTQVSTLSGTNNTLQVSRVGFSIYDETRDNNYLSAFFYDFIASADADPRFVNVTGLTPGWTVRLKDEAGNILASAAANTKGVASLNVASRPIVRNGVIEIYSGSTLILSQEFKVIVGGDIYKRTVSSSVKSAVEECLMYYRMFLNKFAPSITSVAPVYREP